MLDSPITELWNITKPDGETVVIADLKQWCADNDLSYFTVWGNRDGYKAVRMRCDAFSPKIEGYVHITNDLGEVLVSKNNMVHYENMSEALAQSLSNRATGHIHEMVFGNGASTSTGTGAVTYFPPNVTGQLAQLYNQTYRKVVDDLSPLNTAPTTNNLRVHHVQNTLYTDIVITCTLATSEPSGQAAFDNDPNSEAPYVFDELGLKAFDPILGNGRLLSHVIFHPVQKAANRAIEIIYTLRIYMV
jgi:hypothetical protein